MKVANTIGGAAEAFIQACEAGPDYVCNCYNRLMYIERLLQSLMQ